MTEKTEHLIAEARQEESIHDKLGDGFSEGCGERAFYYGHRDRYKRLADALEAATRERAAVPDAAPDGQVIIPIARIHELRAAKDAALAAIGRVRAMHKPVEILAGADFRQARECSLCGDDEPLRYPCSTVQALDGAPEPGEKP